MLTLSDIQQLPCMGEVDVLVCGGGPAGIGAAREGVSVLVAEMGGCLGGIATAGMMSHWGGRSSSKIMTEIWDRTRDAALSVKHHCSLRDLDVKLIQASVED